MKIYKDIEMYVEKIYVKIQRVYKKYKECIKNKKWKKMYNV